MMKKIGTWAFGILVVLYLIGAVFGGDDKSNSSKNSSSDNSGLSKNSENDKSQKVLTKKYSTLPIKQNLSYFVSPQNMAGLDISRIDNSPLSSYAKGLEFGSNRNIREERLHKYFNIDRYNVNAVATAEINSKGYSEFEIDDFEKKLQEEFAKSIQPIRDSYKKVDKHIRIVNLNIPVSYSKKDKTVASIKITNPISLQKLNYSSKPMFLSDFIKKELNNKYISKYIVPSKKKYTFKTVIEYDKDNWSGGFQVKGDAKLLNAIGKVNKGKDTIIELTLYPFYIDYIGRGIPEKIKFVIISFKLKSSNKRSVSNSDVNEIVTDQSFNNKYLIKDNDCPIFNKKDD